MGSWGIEDLRAKRWLADRARWHLVDQARQWQVEQAVPHLYADKSGGTTGERDRLLNPGFQHGEIKPQNL